MLVRTDGFTKTVSSSCLKLVKIRIGMFPFRSYEAEFCLLVPVSSHFQILTAFSLKFATHMR